MNLWLRLIWYAIRVRFMARLALPGEASRLSFRVWPNDLDTSLHMNNGRYLTIMDIGRLDLMARGGLAKAVLANRWTPIASTVVIRYRRELRAFDRYTLETRLLHWAATSVVIEQVFRIDGGRHAGEVAARALFKGGLYDRKARAFVPVERLMREIGTDAVSPPMIAEVEAFLASDEALRGSRPSRKPS